MNNKFKVGDIITGISDNYVITCKNSICIVEAIQERGYVCVRVLKDKHGNTAVGDFVGPFNVSSKDFVLLKGNYNPYYMIDMRKKNFRAMPERPFKNEIRKSKSRKH